jgi:retinol dehydrogenase-14
MTTSSVAGKTVLVTGATSGIGLEAAVELATLGAKVVMVGRDPAKTHEKLEEVKRRSGSGEVSTLLCDFASQAQTRKLAADFRATHDRLDVLVNNAGTVFLKRTVTEDGIESTFAINHLAFFLLTNLLLDLIVRSAPARIVNVASVGHYRGTMDFADLGYEHGYGVLKAYSRSKLGNVLFGLELSRRLDGKGVTVNSMHPGAVATNIWNRGPAWTHPITAAGAKLFLVSVEEGGRRIVYLAADPEVEGKTGLYFEKCKPKTPAPLALDPNLAKRLWDESAKLVELGAEPALSLGVA